MPAASCPADVCRTGDACGPPHRADAATKALVATRYTTGAAAETGLLAGRNHIEEGGCSP
jgi:hypothetical protein